MVSGGNQSRPRGPAMFNSVLSIVVLAVVGALALTARQPAPPTIAEFAPQAQHQIKQAPHQLSSNIGSATGANSPGGSAAKGARKGPSSPVPPAQAPGNVPPVINVPAVKPCYGTPPRQLSFDTQSPPCVPYWSGNNGGATSMGVTANSVLVPLFDQDSTNGARVISDLQTMFNRDFEFYGRYVKMWNNGGEPDSCSTETTMADGYYSGAHPFAIGDPNSTADQCFLQEAARDKMVTVGWDGQMSQASMAQFSPYLYSYAMSYEQDYAQYARFVCTQLAGRDAVYSSDPTLAAQKRTFGLIMVEDSSAYTYDPSALTSALLSDCGVSIAVTEVEKYSSASSTNSASIAQFAQEAVLAMKTHTPEVSTVLINAGPYLSQDFSTAASNQSYFPEWIFLDNDEEWDPVAQLFWPTASEQAGLFTLTTLPAQVPYPYTTVNQALDSVDPGFQITDDLHIDQDQEAYWQALLIASGIQLAGPDLTPATFRRGLQQAEFPNPYSPEQEGIASFLGGNLSMTTTVALAWWNSSAQAPYPDDTNAGAWCYADGAARWSLNDWPATTLLPAAPLAAQPCDTTPPGT